MEAPMSTPSRLPNCYRKILYRFLAAVHLASLGHLSNALVYCACWDDPMVIEERNLYLSLERQKVNKALTMWRCNAVRKAIHAWQAVKRAERQRFRSKSYFNLLD